MIGANIVSPDSVRHREKDYYEKLYSINSTIANGRAKNRILSMVVMFPLLSQTLDVCYFCAGKEENNPVLFL